MASPCTDCLAVQVATPASGDTVTLVSGKTLLIINPAGTIAALTLAMVAGSYNGQMLDIIFTQAIVTLTLSGSALLIALGNPVANTKFHLRWNSTLEKWC